MKCIEFNAFIQIYWLLTPIVALFNCHNFKFNQIPAPFVYTIEQHHDSLYYSTPDGEIFRLNPDKPDSAVLVAIKKGHPIRSILFTKDKTLYASSYHSGIYKVLNDSLEELPNGSEPTWSMKQDSSGNLWLASKNGIFKQSADTFIRFTNLREAYDLDFFNGSLVVACRNGILFFDLQSGECIRSICRDTICWMVHSYDTLLIGGGRGFCAFISKNTHILKQLGQKENIPWDCALDENGAIFLGSQTGLFFVKKDDKKARCIGYGGKCIKSVFIDNKKRLWIGRYFKISRS